MSNDKKDAPIDAAVVRASAQVAKSSADKNERADKKERADEPQAPKRSSSELSSDIVKNREALASTLDAIEYKLNVPKQAKIIAAELSNQFRVLRDENPAALAAGIAGVALAVGGAVFFGVRAITKR